MSHVSTKITFQHCSARTGLINHARTLTPDDYKSNVCNELDLISHQHCVMMLYTLCVCVCSRNLQLMNCRTWLCIDDTRV